MNQAPPEFIHLHLVSDSTGETLTTVTKAVVVQYPRVRAIEHFHPLVRNRKQLARVLQEIEAAPGIVLYTIVNPELAGELEQSCKQWNMPCVAVLDRVMQVFEVYIGAPKSETVGGQHMLDAEYFRRIDALNFSMAHDDGQLPRDLDDADIIVLGISRTSKTPTSIYLANRGYKTANLPLVPGIEVPERLLRPTRAFVVGLVASADRIVQIRRNRVLTLADRNLEDYVDKSAIQEEIAYTRRLCQRNGWPVIDVTRRSIEETAAAILKLKSDRDAGHATTQLDRGVGDDDA
ncbi:MAG: pyruvate, phosphate dikinase/phosphoenolpyruvate synthase regulator [Rhizobiales bacterium]|nr:pyruvate, phosphate dikinase/phosphoenolpyruvate synthase regulator [Hyphomicrobiales bacterium]